MMDIFNEASRFVKGYYLNIQLIFRNRKVMNDLSFLYFLSKHNVILNIDIVDHSKVEKMLK